MITRNRSQEKMRSKRNKRRINTLNHSGIKKDNIIMIRHQARINRSIKSIYLQEINEINNMPLHPVSIEEKVKIKKQYGQLLKWAD
ncbi:hypothetical protein [Desulfosporosinus sp. FKB]|uniref:hypothetical protein n=1 Tax=Desulfosporosinus sp. FKB TaxID=1969835 RepID=UPI000B4A177C|nr:hypothetical protein [Desulfosporosinus sp. FKB]